MYTGSSEISAYNPFDRWPQTPDVQPSRQKELLKKENKPANTTAIKATQSKVTGLRTHINKLPETCKAQSSDFSTLGLYELLDLRECSHPCRKQANEELIKRLNNHEITFFKLGIHRFVPEEISPGVKKIKPLLNQLIDFFGESCSKIHHLNLTYSETDFTLLKHFTGLRTLNLSANHFNEFWVLELMPNLIEIKMD